MQKSINLNKRQLLAVEMAAAGARGKAIAKQLKVTEETVSRWKQVPEFQAGVNAILKDTMESARDRLRCLVGKALETLEGAIDGDDLPIKEKVNASFKILSLCDTGALVSDEIGPDDPEIISKKQMHEDLMDKLNIPF